MLKPMTTTVQFILNLIIAAFILGFTPGCAKKSETPPPITPVIPVITTTSVSGISQTAAESGGTITSDGGASVTFRGVCWNTAGGPVITDQHTADGTGTGTFTSQFAGLSPNTLYYARSYATNSAGTAYGNQQTFRTLKIVADSVTDVDGNLYHVIRIGNQSWLQENLRVTKYRNGDVIPVVATDAQWKNQTAGALCNYDNTAANGTIYGKLYNYFALTNPHGLCPTGWHVPSDGEWKTLGTILGGDAVAGGKLKSTGTIEQGTGLWYAPNTGATNSSWFTGLPGGYRINYGTYYSIGNVGYFWSTSDTASVNAWNYVLDANNNELLRNYNLMTNGFSVRCCKD